MKRRIEAPAHDTRPVHAPPLSKRTENRARICANIQTLGNTEKYRKCLLTLGNAHANIGTVKRITPQDKPRALHLEN